MPSTMDGLRAYPKQSIEVRLKNWAERVEKKSGRFKRPRKMFLPDKLVEDLGLDCNPEEDIEPEDNVVELREDKSFWHVSTDSLLIAL
jgi:hypothetical protein